MRKKVVAPTAKDLVLKIAKNEGKSRNDFSSFLEMQRQMLPLYDVKPDANRNQYVAIRKAI